MTQKIVRIALVGAECEENLAVRYIRSSLEKAGFTVIQIPFDTAGETEEVATELAESDTDLAGFSMVFTYRAREFAHLATRARELGYRGHIVVGGHFAAFNAEALLRDVPAFDSVAIGEGERLMVDLATNIGDTATVRGLVWRSAQDRTVRNPASAPILDLDALPYPTRRTPPDSYLGLPIANMLSSRGCTHSCHFCSIAAWHGMCGGPRYRMRRPEHVAAEVGALYRQGYRLFNFHDDNFILDSREANLSRINELLKALQEQKVGRIGFAIKARPDRADAEAFRALRSMGLFRVFLGIEAGTETSLRNLGRRQSLSDNEKALSVLNGLDLHVCFNLLIFNPDSTIEDFLDNVSFLEHHPDNPLNFCRTEVYAGTPMERQLREQGRLVGGYWGHGYTIADERAQRAFELTHALLFDRHHGETNLHHLTMRVDYERQLLNDFFRCPTELRDRSKDYIRRVNMATAGLLRLVAAAAMAGHGKADAGSPALRDLRAAIASDTQSLNMQGHAIIADIRREASTRKGWQPRHTSVAKLAASLTLAAGLTRCGRSYEYETAAEPAQVNTAGQPSGASATNQPAGIARPPDGDMSGILVAASKVFITVAQYLAEAQNVEVELWINADGKISFVAVYKDGMAPKANAGELSTDDIAKVDRLLKDLGADKFAVREKATVDLKGMGSKVEEIVRKHRSQSTDPEVQERCKSVLQEIDGLAKLTNHDAMWDAVKAISIRVSEDKRGKRYVCPLNKRQIEEFKRIGNRMMNPPHMFEMVPAPRD